MRSAADLPYLRSGRNRPIETGSVGGERMAILDLRSQEALAYIVRNMYPAGTAVSVVLRDCLIRAAEAEHDPRINFVSSGGGRHQGLWLCRRSDEAARVVIGRIEGPQHGAFSRAMRYSILLAEKRAMRSVRARRPAA